MTRRACAAGVLLTASLVWTDARNDAAVPPQRPAAVRAERGDSPRWSAPSLVAAGPDWFPEIAIDPEHRVHLVWSHGEGLFYRRLTGESWTSPLDLSAAVAAPRPGVGDLVRAAIVVDPRDTVHVLAATLGIGMPTHTAARADAAEQLTRWSAPRRVGVGGAGYYCAIAADHEQRLHAVYIERPAGVIPSDTFYRQSADGGRTWSAPVNLSASPAAGSSRPFVSVDAAGVVHVSWDEGWDRISGRGTIARSIYRALQPDGQWSQSSFGAPDRPAAQLVVTGARTARLAVWRSTDEVVAFQVSRDGGARWTPPAPVPGIAARTWNSPPFDRYVLVPDGAGLVHFALVGRTQDAPQGRLQVLHLTWDGQAWSRPDVVVDRQDRFPEYPGLAVSDDRVYLSWFARTDLWDSTAAKDVWVSRLLR